MKINSISFYGNPIKPIDKNVSNIVSSCSELARSPRGDEVKGFLSEFEIKNINEVKELFELAHNSIKSIAKSCNTRNAIKNGYSGLKKGVAGSRILEFSNIGEKGEDISVNVRIDHGKTKKAVIIIDDKQYVISPKGAIEKNPSMRFARETNVRQKGDKMEYYTQNEIDGLNINTQIYALKRELKKYIDYILSRSKEIEAIRSKKADNVSGSVVKYQHIIDVIGENFKFFKSSINKLSYNALDKDIFRIQNKIKTFHSQNSILFKNATPDGRSLFLIYTKINKKSAMKVFLMDYGNKKIDKSYVIYENKLAKFHPKKVNEKPSHLNYDFHYYTQEEIDNSGLDSYLNMIAKRLEDINSNLRYGILERLNKKGF